MKKENSDTPQISIDEALDLYIKTIFPQGMPEGEQSEKVLGALKEKISSDKPEWAKSFNSGSQEQHTAPPNSSTNYAALKALLVEQANQEDIPEDPEERHFYLRRQEAEENRLTKKLEEEENQRKETIRHRLMQKHRDTDKETIERAVLIRRALEKRAEQIKKLQHEKPSLKSENKLKPDFANKPNIEKRLQASDSLNHRQTISFSESSKPEIPKEDRKASSKPMPVESTNRPGTTMSLEDRLESLRNFNKQRRNTMKTREEVLKLSGKDQRFDISLNGAETTFGLELESPQKGENGFTL